MDREIKKFCITCFTDWKNDNFTSSLMQMCKEICECYDFHSITELFYTTTTSNETFKCAYQLMCDKLFQQFGAKPQYILTLIAFSLQLDVRMQPLCSWYQTDLLINLLHNVLQKVDFNPRNLPWNNRRGNCSLL